MHHASSACALPRPTYLKPKPPSLLFAFASVLTISPRLPHPSPYCRFEHTLDHTQFLNITTQREYRRESGLAPPDNPKREAYAYPNCLLRPLYPSLALHSFDGHLELPNHDLPTLQQAIRRPFRYGQLGRLRQSCISQPEPVFFQQTTYFCHDESNQHNHATRRLRRSPNSSGTESRLQPIQAANWSAHRIHGYSPSTPNRLPKLQQWNR